MPPRWRVKVCLITVELKDLFGWYYFFMFLCSSLGLSWFSRYCNIWYIESWFIRSNKFVYLSFSHCCWKLQEGLSLYLSLCYIYIRWSCNSEDVGGVELRHHKILSSAKDGYEWSAKCPGHLNSWGRAFITHWMAGYVGLIHGKEKNLCFGQESNSSFPIYSLVTILTQLYSCA